MTVGSDRIAAGRVQPRWSQELADAAAAVPTRREIVPIAASFGGLVWGCEIFVDIVQTSGGGNCTEVMEGNKEVEGRSCAAQERSCVRLLLSRLSFVDPVPSAFHLRLL